VTRRLLVGAALLLAACGGGSAEDAPATRGPSQETPMATATLTAPASPGDPAAPVTPSPAATAGAPLPETALLIDVDVGVAGVQETIEVNAGAALDVAVVLDGVPADAGGVSGFAFVLQYDRRVLVAETLFDAPSIDANPDLNQEALGPGGAAWECVPAPEGDLDDPGGIAGDGNASSGQAFLSCFASDGAAPGASLVLAHVHFTAVATGESVLRLSSATVADASGREFAGCESEAPPARCGAATVTVR
jgi:hypothetical protein